MLIFYSFYDFIYYVVTFEITRTAFVQYQKKPTYRPLFCSYFTANKHIFKAIAVLLFEQHIIVNDNGRDFLWNSEVTANILVIICQPFFV